MCFSLGLVAQTRAIPVQKAPPVVIPSAGALGGSFASVGMSRPLGGIAPPTFPIGVPARHNPHNQTSVPRYVGPVYYVPNVYGTDYWGSSPSTFNTPAAPVQYAAPEPAAAPAPAPIIINQYFGSREAPVTGPASAVAPASNDSPDLKYYLIAYKDHSVYTALAYWVEGDIFHYVTTRNTHNQASLSLIDLDQTTKLNEGNSLPFSLSAGSPPAGK